MDRQTRENKFSALAETRKGALILRLAEKYDGREPVAVANSVTSLLEACGFIDVYSARKSRLQRIMRGEQLGTWHSGAEGWAPLAWCVPETTRYQRVVSEYERLNS